MNASQRMVAYTAARRYGRILLDFSPSPDVRLMIIKHNGYNYNVTLMKGEVFSLSLD